MPRPVGDIKVMFSSSALFDTQAAHQIYVDKGLEAYQHYMHENADVPFEPGPAFNLIATLLQVNQWAGKPLFECCLHTKNALSGPPEQHPSGLRVENSIAYYKLSLEMATYKEGRQISIRDHKAFGTDLLLTTDEADVQTAVDNDIAGALVLPRLEGAKYAFGRPLNWAFDYDGVIVNGDSEIITKSSGLEAFQQHERENGDVPMGAGPFLKLAKKLSDLRQDFIQQNDSSPFGLSIVTARGATAKRRISTTLQHYKIHIPDIICLSGGNKFTRLKAYRRTVFFDDQMRHLEEARKVILCGHVPYKQGSQMYQYKQSQHETPKVA